MYKIVLMILSEQIRNNEWWGLEHLTHLEPTANRPDSFSRHILQTCGSVQFSAKMRTIDTG